MFVDLKNSKIFSYQQLQKRFLGDTLVERERESELKKYAKIKNY